MLFEFRLRDTALNLMFNIIDENWINTLSCEMKIDRYAKDYNTESQLRSLVFFHLSKLDSLRNLHGDLYSNPFLRGVCRYSKCISLSQMSRDTNNVNPDFYADIFWYLLDKARKLGCLSKIKESLKRMTIAIDGMFVTLNKNVFKYAESGYCAMEKGQAYGVKIHNAFLVDKLAPVAISITTGNVHDINEFDELRDKALELIPSRDIVFAFDKGYYDLSRFQEMCDKGIKFVTPMKSNGLAKGKITAIYGIPHDDIVGDFVYYNPLMKDPIRLVVARKNNNQIWLLTNIWDEDAEKIQIYYGNRWAIEDLHKQVKQHFDIKKPIGKSYNAFLIQTYTLFITYLLILIFKYLYNYSGTFLNLKRTLKVMWYLPFEISMTKFSEGIPTKNLTEIYKGEFMQH